MKNLRFAFIFIVMLMHVNVNVIGEELPGYCSQDCSVTYGAVLGESASGVEAYSNCSNRCVNPSPFFIDDTFTGIKWQCVEYARRWLLVNEGVVYGDVDIAADIWQLEIVRTPDKKNTKPFESILNGENSRYVQRGDLLIYSRAFLNTGHVAVVTKVDATNQYVYLAEQNFDNETWDGDYARRISYVMHGDAMWLLDPYLIGWKRVINQ